MQEETTPNIIIKLLNTNNKEKILKELEEKIHRIQMNKLQMISCQKFCKTEDKVVTSLKFWEKKICQHSVPGKSIFQIWRKREYIFRQIKAERINSKFALLLTSG